MTNSLTISKSPPKHADMDYQRLRALAVGQLEKLASEHWTDFNTHDPGITMLEALCYAITDLGHRHDYPIEDLLASPEGNEANMRRQFQTAAQALACEPVTETDYRKLFMDVPGVVNAWLTKHDGLTYFAYCKSKRISLVPTNDPHENQQPFTLNGLYNVLLQLSPNVYVGASSEDERQAVEQGIFDKIKKTYQAHRNLCEDVMSIRTVPYTEFAICADIQLSASADFEAVHAQILYEVQRFLTPGVRRYALQEMLDAGKTTDEIFDGHVPRFGFFDEAELENSALPESSTTIRTSDLIGVILAVPGIIAIPKIHLQLDPDDEQGTAWSLPIPKGHLPKLRRNSPLRFFKDVFRYLPKADEVSNKLAALEAAELARSENLQNAARDLSIPLGTWQDTGRWSSVQQELPALYGTSRAGVPPTGSPDGDTVRLAQARQLRAYLLFFDQILANHAKLLEQLPHLLSASPAGEHLRTSYFAQAVEGVQELQVLFRLLSEDPEVVFSEKMEVLLEQLNSLEFSKLLKNETLHQRRRNRHLDHLLARYAERFDDYVLMMHQVFGGRRQEWEIIDDKDDFLREQPLLSQYRARAYNVASIGEAENGADVALKNWYTADDMGTDPVLVNVAGIVRRVARLTGIDNYRRRNLANIDYEIYQENDDDEISEWRFRVIDIGGQKILLSGSTKYSTEEAAILEMRQAVNRAMLPDGYERKVTVNGKFYFNITDETGEVVGRRIEYFNSETARETAIQYLIDFLTERYSEEGLFLFEHLLLRPEKPADRFLPVCTDDGCQTCEALDPYSFRVSVVLPGWAPRFTNLVFRDYFERMLRQELPAHVLAKVCWIGQGQMADLEARYRTWLDYRQTVAQTGLTNTSDTSLNNLLEILTDLHTLYPPGTLHDCEEDREDRPIVLGRSHLGTQREEDLNPDDG